MTDFKLHQKTKAYIQVHVATLLYGLTAILGDLIQLNAIVLVWWRVLLASFGMYIVAKAMRLNIRDIFPHFKTFFWLGAIIGFHWVTFYGAIKLSNASLTLICFSTTSLFTAILEPIFTHKKINFLEIFFGLLIIPFIVIIAKDVNLAYINGLFMGLFSAFLVSIFGVFNKKYLQDNDSVLVSGVEMLSAFFVLSVGVLGLYFYDGSLDILPSTEDWIYILILAFLCTTFAFIITTDALKHLSAFSTALIINLEPVYGIILAFLILNDGAQLTPTFYYCGLAIAVIVFAFPVLNKIYLRNR